MKEMIGKGADNWDSWTVGSISLAIGLVVAITTGMVVWQDASRPGPEDTKLHIGVEYPEEGMWKRNVVKEDLRYGSTKRIGAVVRMHGETQWWGDGGLNERAKTARGTLRGPTPEAVVRRVEQTMAGENPFRGNLLAAGIAIMFGLVVGLIAAVMASAPLAMVWDWIDERREAARLAALREGG